ncbi:MAG: winged helix-turn-helix transcriptional regulator [Oscillospiraceae bacterium]|nr:winged helix-turn-helix transcriptional regulator [Oscillospiraceae bacterium]
MNQDRALCCEETEVHEGAVEQVRSQLPQDEVLYDLAELFKIFGDNTRVKILYALLEAELCVCDIAKLMDVSQSAVSHQLRVLKGSKLVKFRREGKTLYYSLADEHVFRILSQGMEHILEGPETP